MRLQREISGRHGCAPTLASPNARLGDFAHRDQAELKRAHSERTAAGTRAHLAPLHRANIAALLVPLLGIRSGGVGWGGGEERAAASLFGVWLDLAT